MRVRFVFPLIVVIASVATNAVADEQQAAKDHFRAGTVRFDAGDWHGAISEYEEGYRAFPLPEFLFNIARARESAGELVEARDAYVRFLQRDAEARGVPEARSRLAGVMALQHGKRLKVITKAELGTVPENIKIEGQLRFRLGTDSLGRKEYAEALRDYERAFAIVPLADFLFNIAKVCDEAGNLAKAQDRYLEYLAHEPAGRGHEVARNRVVDMLLADLAKTAPPRRVANMKMLARPALEEAIVVEAPKNRRLWILAPVLVVVAAGIGVGLGVGLTAGKDPYSAAQVKLNLPFN